MSESVGKKNGGSGGSTGHTEGGGGSAEAGSAEKKGAAATPAPTGPLIETLPGNSASQATITTESEYIDEAIADLETPTEGAAKTEFVAEDAAAAFVATTRTGAVKDEKAEMAPGGADGAASGMTIEEYSRNRVRVHEDAATVWRDPAARTMPNGSSSYTEDDLKLKGSPMAGILEFDGTQYEYVETPTRKLNDYDVAGYLKGVRGLNFSGMAEAQQEAVLKYVVSNGGSDPLDQINYVRDLLASGQLPEDFPGNDETYLQGRLQGDKETVDAAMEAYKGARSKYDKEERWNIATSATDAQALLDALEQDSGAAKDPHDTIEYWSKHAVNDAQARAAMDGALEANGEVHADYATWLDAHPESQRVVTIEAAIPKLEERIETHNAELAQYEGIPAWRDYYAAVGGTATQKAAADALIDAEATYAQYLKDNPDAPQEEKDDAREQARERILADATLNPNPVRDYDAAVAAAEAKRPTTGELPEEFQKTSTESVDDWYARTNTHKDELAATRDHDQAVLDQLKAQQETKEYKAAQTALEKERAKVATADQHLSDAASALQDGHLAEASRALHDLSGKPIHLERKDFDEKAQKKIDDQRTAQRKAVTDAFDHAKTIMDQPGKWVESASSLVTNFKTGAEACKELGKMFSGDDEELKAIYDRIGTRMSKMADNLVDQSNGRREKILDQWEKLAKLYQKAQQQTDTQKAAHDRAFGEKSTRKARTEGRGRVLSDDTEEEGKEATAEKNYWEAQIAENRYNKGIPA